MTKRGDELHSCPGESPVRKLAAVPTIPCPWRKALARGDFPPIGARSSRYRRLSSRALPRGRAAGGGWLTAGSRRRTRFAVIAIPVATAGSRANRSQIQVRRGQTTLLPTIERQQEGGEGQQMDDGTPLAERVQQDDLGIDEVEHEGHTQDAPEQMRRPQPGWLAALAPDRQQRDQRHAAADDKPDHA